MKRTIKVLLIEDNNADADLLHELLIENKHNRFSFEVEHATRLSAGLERIESGQFDIVLLDLSLPAGKERRPSE